MRIRIEMEHDDGTLNELQFRDIERIAYTHSYRSFTLELRAARAPDKDDEDDW